MSLTCTMLGCASSEQICASRLNSSVKSGSLEYAGSTRFTATSFSKPPSGE